MRPATLKYQAGWKIRCNRFGIVHSTYLGKSGNNFQKNIVLFCLKIFFNFTNSVDPDDMQHYSAFHLGLNCLQKYSFRDFSNTKCEESECRLL